ncbi:MAG: stage III sporulation protein AB [Oscillospiraceae bacterium]|nr:stage III sporulation protein AB [Oscillospiraceae bacterium]
MILKILGVISVLIGCGGVGFHIAYNYRREIKTLRQLINILDFMECELQYHLTPLPELCRLTAHEFRDDPGPVFAKLAIEMDSQISTDVERCMQVSLASLKKIPPITRTGMEMLGKNLGRFDLSGQLKGIESVRSDSVRKLRMLEDNRDNRIRSYQTLGLCAGAALAILLI